METTKGLPESPEAEPAPAPAGFSFTTLDGEVYQVGPGIVTTWTNQQVRLLKKRRLMASLSWIASEKKTNPSDALNQIEEESIRELLDTERKGFIDALELIDDEDAIAIFLVAACDRIKDLEHAARVLDRSNLIDVFSGLVELAKEVRDAAENLRRRLYPVEEREGEQRP